MGYQQKLIYIFSLLVLGGAIVVGIQKFNASSMEANIESLKLDLLGIAANIQMCYFKSRCPKSSDHPFFGLTVDPEDLEKLFIKSYNSNGTFKIVKSGNDFLIIQAIGKEDYDGDGQNLTVEIKVFPDSVQTSIISY